MLSALRIFMGERPALGSVEYGGIGKADSDSLLRRKNDTRLDSSGRAVFKALAGVLPYIHMGVSSPSIQLALAVRNQNAILPIPHPPASSRSFLSIRCHARSSFPTHQHTLKRSSKSLSAVCSGTKGM